MSLSEKIRRVFRDPPRFYRVCWVLSFAGFLVAAVIELGSGDPLIAICSAAAALVPGSAVIATTRFIRDRDAARPL